MCGICEAKERESKRDICIVQMINSIFTISSIQVNVCLMHCCLNEDRSRMQSLSVHKLMSGRENEGDEERERMKE